MFKNFETYCRLCIHIYIYILKFLYTEVSNFWIAHWGYCFSLDFCWSNFHRLLWGLCRMAELQQPMSPWVAFSSAKRLSAMSAMRQVWHLQIGWIYDSCIILSKYVNKLSFKRFWDVCTKKCLPKWWFCWAKLGTFLQKNHPTLGVFFVAVFLARSMQTEWSSLEDLTISYRSNQPLGFVNEYHLNVIHRIWFMMIYV